MMKNRKKAVILLSGGMDSAVSLYAAKAANFACYALSFFYGQRHQCELDAAKKIAETAEVAEHMIIPIDLTAWGGSALTDKNTPVPHSAPATKIPNTYVPARNLIFLSLAVAWAEVIGARDIFIGVNSVDYSGYPDCRPEFIDSFRRTAKLGTRAADENWEFAIHAPLQNLSKAEIIALGNNLGVDFALTTSCYDPDEEGRSCGTCPSCLLRRKGFADAGVPDVTEYR